MIYFIRDTETGFIKIGTTSDIDKRMNAFKTSNPNIELLGMSYGSFKEEREIHKRACRIRSACTVAFLTAVVYGHAGLVDWDAIEDDALPPRELQRIVKKALTDRTDLEQMELMIRRENRERAHVKKKLGLDKKGKTK